LEFIFWRRAAAAAARKLRQAAARSTKARGAKHGKGAQARLPCLDTGQAGVSARLLRIPALKERDAGRLLGIPARYKSVLIRTSL
jgi:hypothetical protein